MKKLLLFGIASFFAFNFLAQSTWHYLPNAPGSGRIDDVFFIIAFLPTQVTNM